MEASIRRYSDVVKLLLDGGAQVDLRNKYGSTSLMLARKNDIIDSQTAIGQWCSN